MSVIRKYVEDCEANRYYNLSEKAIELYEELSGKKINIELNCLERDDPYFISVVEILGKEANGEDTEFRIFNVYEGTIGVVYSVMNNNFYFGPELKDAFKKLSGYEYHDNVPRHDINLVKTVEKIGEPGMWYPVNYFEIEYIPESEIDSYEIIQNMGETVIYSKNRKTTIYGLYLEDEENKFQENLCMLSYDIKKIEDYMIDEKKSVVKLMDIYKLKDFDVNLKEGEYNYSFLSLCFSIKDFDINNLYLYKKIVKKDFPIEIIEKDKSSFNSTMQIYVDEEILLYFENKDELELFQHSKYANYLSYDSVIFDVYHEDGIINN